jgi:aminopeptidase
VPDLSLGAANAVRVCMGVTAGERVLILTDDSRAPIAEALAEQCRFLDAPYKVLSLETYGPRPILSLPEKLAQEVRDFHPVVSFLALESQKGELAFRQPYMKLVIQELKARHGHMINIDAQLMQEGMTADYEEIHRLTMHVNDIVKEARLIEVQAPSGTDLRATLDPGRLRWYPCHGLYHEPATWGNLPEGETFTSPASLDGVIGAEVLGDHFSGKYGVLSTPARIEVSGGRVRKVDAPGEELQAELTEYLAQHENSNRAGEFAIGTNVALKRLTGNLLQDEKIPGVHVAFGHPYGEETGADWHCPSHIDMVATRSTIKVDGQYLMRDGEFLL